MGVREPTDFEVEVGLRGFHALVAEENPDAFDGRTFDEMMSNSPEKHREAVAVFRKVFAAVFAVMPELQS